MQKTALVRRTSGMHLEGTADSAARLEIDDGTGAIGFRPSELVLVGLAGCTAQDVISILEKKRQSLEAYEVAVQAEQREAHPHAFTAVSVEHRLVGPTLEVEAVRRSIELSATKYCPVTAVLASGIARIEHRYVVRNAEGEHRGTVAVTGPQGAGIPSLSA